MNPNSTLVADPESLRLRIRKSWLTKCQICTAMLLASVVGCDKLPLPKPDQPAPQQQPAPKAPVQPPQVVQQSPPPKVEPKAPPARSADDVLEDLQRAQGNPALSGLTDAMLEEAAGLDEEHRARVTNINANSTSKITPKGIQALQRFPNLKVLAANQLPMSRNAAWLSELAKLTELEMLTLERAGLVDDDLQYLKPLQNLKVLVLNDNPGVTDQGFIHLKHLLALEQLHIGFCQAINGSGFRQFKDPKIKHPGLKVIVAHHTSFGTQGMEAIHQWKSIEELQLGQSNVNDNTLFGLNGLINLRSVSLGYDPVSIIGMTKANFRGKKKLETVIIDNVGAVNDACLDLFKFNKSLKLIRLKNTGVTQAGVDRLKKTLKTGVEVELIK